jgi:hypothetical protein
MERKFGQNAPKSLNLNQLQTKFSFSHHLLRKSGKSKEKLLESITEIYNCFVRHYQGFLSKIPRNFIIRNSEMGVKIIGGFS